MEGKQKYGKMQEHDSVETAGKMVRRGNESKSMEKCRQMAYKERKY